MKTKYERIIIELRQHKEMENMKKNYRLIKKLNKEFNKADKRFDNLPNKKNEESLMEVAKMVFKRLEGLYEKQGLTRDDLGVDGKALYNNAQTVICEVRKLSAI